MDGGVADSSGMSLDSINVMMRLYSSTSSRRGVAAAVVVADNLSMVVGVKLSYLSSLKKYETSCLKSCENLAGNYRFFVDLQKICNFPPKTGLVITCVSWTPTTNKFGRKLQIFC